MPTTMPAMVPEGRPVEEGKAAELVLLLPSLTPSVLPGRLAEVLVEVSLGAAVPIEEPEVEPEVGLEVEVDDDEVLAVNAIRVLGSKV